MPKKHIMCWDGTLEKMNTNHAILRKITTKMMFTTPFAVAALALTASFYAAPTLEKRTAGDFGLSLPAHPNFDINYLQTFDVYYANDIMFLGEIKYQL